MNLYRRLMAVLAVSAISLFAYGCGGGGGGGNSGGGGGSSSSSSSSSSETSYVAGSETDVSDTSSFLFNSDVTALGNGGYAVVWQTTGLGVDNDGAAIGYRVYSATGASVTSATLANTTTTGAQAYPTVAGLKNGGFVVVWQDSSSSTGTLIRAQRFDNSGVKQGVEAQVSANEGYELQNPKVIGLNNGGYVVFWADYYPNMGGAIPPRNNLIAQVFDSSGNKVGTEKQLQAFGDGMGPSYDLAALSGGGFVLVRDQLGTRSGSSFDANVSVQIYTDAADTSGTAFYANGTTHDAAYPVVTGLTGGGFAVVFSNSSGAPAPVNWRMRYQLFTATGGRTGTEAFVSEMATSQQNTPSVTALSNGGFVTAWEDASGITAQAFAASGVKSRTSFSVHSGHNYTKLMGLTGGGFVASWIHTPDTNLNTVRLKPYSVQ